MNTKTAVYAAGGGLAAFAIVVYVIFGSGMFVGVQSGSNQNVSNMTLPITLSIRDVIPTQINNRTASIEVAFDAHNPNQGTAILEAIQYDISVDGKRIASGSIGNRLEGFLASSADIYPVIGGGSVILKDKQIVEKIKSTPDAWTKIKEGKAGYVVTGTYSYKELSGLQANSGDKDFKFVLPSTLNHNNESSSG
ncbi:MAG TPA: hypothetical protein VEL11_07615 [Candidatus Bathyarchaeia archaeon]|nr:hypothetical protein [Candidatus Bathyarchaeia archaeon]